MTAKKANSGGTTKRVLLVDDHPIMRGGLAKLINNEPDLVVCCEAADARHAMDRVAEGNPDLVVVDISLEGKSGLELLRDIQAFRPEMPLLVLSMHDEALYAERALRAGARGYVMKKAGGEVVLEAIRAVLSGKIYVSSRVSEQIIEVYSSGRAARSSSPIEMLTDREFEIFKLIGEGCSTHEIAGRLSISPKTVDVHRQHLKEKLRIPSSTSLVQHAVRWVESEAPR